MLGTAKAHFITGAWKLVILNKYRVTLNSQSSAKLSCGSVEVALKGGGYPAVSSRKQKEWGGTYKNVQSSVRLLSSRAYRR